MPPRENGGNIDAKQLTKGSRLFIPVNVEGALYSVGDGHYAQGDSDCCLTAIKMGATMVVRLQLHKGEAERLNIRWPRFSHPDYCAARMGRSSRFLPQRRECQFVRMEPKKEKI